MQKEYPKTCKSRKQKNTKQIKTKGNIPILLTCIIHKNELYTRRADEIIELQLFVRVNLDIENHLHLSVNITYCFDFQSSTLRVKNS